MPGRGQRPLPSKASSPWPAPHAAEAPASHPDPVRFATAKTRVTKELKLKVSAAASEVNPHRYAAKGCRPRQRAWGPHVVSLRRHEFLNGRLQPARVIPISFPQAALGAEIEIAGIRRPQSL